MQLILALLLTATAFQPSASAKNTTAKKVAVVAGIGVVGVLALCLANSTSLKSQTSDLRAIGTFASNNNGAVGNTRSLSTAPTVSPPASIHVTSLPPVNGTNPPVDMSCLQPQQKTAYHVVALQSQLMVDALTCDLRDEYNAFVVHYRSALIAERQIVEKHLNGKSSRNRARETSFTTDLANHQSPSKRDDATYCSSRRSLFAHLRNRSVADMKQYAVANPQPMVAVCGR